MNENINMTRQLSNFLARPTNSGEIAHFSNHRFRFACYTLGSDFGDHGVQLLRIASHQYQPGACGSKQTRNFCSKTRSWTSDNYRLTSQVKI